MKQTFKSALLSAVLLAAGICTVTADDDINRKTYENPVIPSSTPDPTIIKCEEDGFYYLYGTEDTRNMPIYRSKNLVDWIFVGTAFNEASRPACVGPNSGVDRGVLFRSQDIGVTFSIDQFYIEDNGKKYLIWGSYNGIYMIELTDDGLRVKPGAQKVQLVGNLTEASYVYKRDGYYYLFGSTGTCCEGAKSTYHIVYGRSDKLEGPYVNKSGGRMLDNQSETLIEGDDFVAGPGHNAEFVVDDNGDTWIPYHGYLRDNEGLGRVVFIDKVQWKDGWPYVEGGHPSRTSTAPYFKE